MVLWSVTLKIGALPKLGLFDLSSAVFYLCLIRLTRAAVPGQKSVAILCCVNLSLFFLLQ